MTWSQPNCSMISTARASPRTRAKRRCEHATRNRKQTADAKAEARGPQINDDAYNARMAAMYREVVLKEKPVVAENGFIPLGALTKPNGNGNGSHARNRNRRSPNRWRATKLVAIW